MEEDSIGSRPKRPLRGAILIVGYVAAALLFSSLLGATENQPLPEAMVQAASGPAVPSPEAPPWRAIFTPATVILCVGLLALSAFLSACEIAFFSLHRITLRNMRDSKRVSERLVGQLMAHPGNLLTAIVMANSIVNVLFSLSLATAVARYLALAWEAPPSLAFPLAVVFTAALLIILGEIVPKVLAVKRPAVMAQVAAPAIYLIDKALYPVRDAMIVVVQSLFRITGFSKMRPAPFVTDEEFVSMLSEGEATGVIEKEERQMIQGIIEYSDVMLREILIPRPDIIGLRDTATVKEAVTLYRDEGYSRMPVYGDSIDAISGILYAKDLLPLAEQGAWEEPIAPLVRKAHFVPETMSVASFMKAVQKMRTHLAIVVDEFGGTEGLVTLEDALREVVGEIAEEDEDEEPMIEDLGEGRYRADGGYTLHEFQELTGIALPDEEHTTIAGFLMDHTEKIPSEGDTIAFEGIVFTVEAVDGKRVSTLTFEVPREAEPASISEPSS